MSLPKTQAKTNILLVEDSEEDVFIAKHAFQKSKRANDTIIHVARDGVEALLFLQHKGQYAEVPRPDLILLDLNMPRMDGRELLAVVKQDPDLKRIPVVVLTTSDWDVDVTQAYDSHANSYITKAVDMRRFSDQINTFLDYWFDLVVQPAAIAQEAAASQA